MRRIWAASERLIPRAVTALATVTAAAVTDPLSIGWYSWAVLGLTFYGAVTELPIRQVAFSYLSSVAGQRILRNYAFAAGIGGILFMSVTLGLLFTLSRGANSSGITLELLPLVFVPVAQASAAMPTAVLQVSGLWAQVSLQRTAASVLGAAVGIPTVFISRSVLGAALAIAFSEIAYAVLVRRSSFRVAKLSTTMKDSTPEGYTKDFWPSYRHMVAFSALAWFQGQAERGLIGLWAGTSALGSYSLGTAVGRSGGDAIAGSQAQILRADLANLTTAASDHAIRELLGRNIRMAVILIASASIVVVMVSEFALSPILGQQWAPALGMVPILALTAIPMAIAVASVPVQIHKSASRIVNLAPAICLLFAPVVALAATESLVAAAWFVLLKECVHAAIQAVVMRRATPWRDVAFAGFAIILGSAVIQFSGMLI